jgi:hypothetical protein
MYVTLTPPACLPACLPGIACALCMRPQPAYTTAAAPSFIFCLLSLVPQPATTTHLITHPTRPTPHPNSQTPPPHTHPNHTPQSHTPFPQSHPQFFTAGDPEVRCWTIPAGTLAPQAAGAIHTDFERGFIKAEVRAWLQAGVRGVVVCGACWGVGVLGCACGKGVLGVGVLGCVWLRAGMPGALEIKWVMAGAKWGASCQSCIPLFTV